MEHEPGVYGFWHNLLFWGSLIGGCVFAAMYYALKHTLEGEARDRLEFYAQLTEPLLITAIDPFDKTVEERASLIRSAIEASGNKSGISVAAMPYVLHGGDDPMGQTWGQYRLRCYMTEIQMLREWEAKLKRGQYGAEEIAKNLHGQRDPFITPDADGRFEFPFQRPLTR